MTDKQHKIKFDRSTLSGNWCAQCECGWWQFETSTRDIIACAEAHVAGGEWVEADPYAEKVS